MYSFTLSNPKMIFLIRNKHYYNIAYTDDTLDLEIIFGQRYSKGPSGKICKKFSDEKELIEFVEKTVKRKVEEKYVQVDVGGKVLGKKRGVDEVDGVEDGGKGKRKKVTVGMKGSKGIYGEDGALGIVDPAAGIDGEIVVGEEGKALDVMMVMVDVGKNIDKYYVLQVVEVDEGGFVVYQRWGRTGTAGASLREEFGMVEDARKRFEEKFEDKSGLKWGDREMEEVKGKYRVVKQNFEGKKLCWIDGNIGRWKYWVDDFVDGLATGWYPYDDEGNLCAELLYYEHQSNPWLFQRVVQSGSYCYNVNLLSMKQVNVIHANHKIRHIRRIAPGEEVDDSPPATLLNHHEGGSDNDCKKSTIKPKVKSEPKVEATLAPAPNGTDVKCEPVKIKPEVKEEALRVSNDDEEQKEQALVKAEPKEEPISSEKDSKNGESRVAENSECEEHPASPSGKIIIPVDSMFPRGENYEVVEDYDATLNQSNITGRRNNNKYFRLQLLKSKGGNLLVWTRWGRVGELRGNQTKKIGPFRDFDKAKHAFCKKFRDKTANKWEDRSSFVPKNGKYELLEVDHDADTKDCEQALSTIVKQEKEYLPPTLNNETQELVEMLFEREMYSEAMKQFDIDVNRMPLGQLKESQVQRGVNMLREIEAVLKRNHVNVASLDQLSSRFYQVIPHNFGRRRPPVICTMDMVERSLQMCDVLLDIEKANELMDAAEDASKADETKVLPHPVDSQYSSLRAKLELLESGTPEHDIVVKAFESTNGANRHAQLQNIWKVDRDGEASRFKCFDKLANRKLLWHGTNIAVVAAILSSGLRIMPNSGGRVGKGIYLASEANKSQGYTSPSYSRGMGCMFLAEAATGAEFHIKRDDSSLKKAPDGFDSVVARGRQSPGYESLTIDENHSVFVPTSSPAPCANAQDSSFYQDEYLIYNEDQARIRYIITVKM